MPLTDGRFGTAPFLRGDIHLCSSGLCMLSEEIGALACQGCIEAVCECRFLAGATDLFWPLTQEAPYAVHVGIRCIVLGDCNRIVLQVQYTMPPATRYEHAVAWATCALLEIPCGILICSASQLSIEVPEPLNQAHWLGHLAQITRRMHTRRRASRRQKKPALLSANHDIPRRCLVWINMPFGTTPAVTNEQPSESRPHAAQQVEEVTVTEHIRHFVVFQEIRGALMEETIKDKHRRIVLIPISVRVKLAQGQFARPASKVNIAKTSEQRGLRPFLHGGPSFRTATQDHWATFLLEALDELLGSQL
mmetsp:Transcript_3260/g.5907  ORF Transcript_3260/g.5907 Transcript_3260/m.5907 type:complete len:306 (-) Transcript_3260:248-1165(-)